MDSGHTTQVLKRNVDTEPVLCNRKPVDQVKRESAMWTPIWSSCEYDRSGDRRRSRIWMARPDEDVSFKSRDGLHYSLTALLRS